MNGMPVVVSRFLPHTRFEHTPPENRREARKRAVVAARRKRRGMHAPAYGEHVPFDYSVIVNGTMYVNESAYQTLLKVTP